MNDILFLTVKPKWANLIMSGQKTLELRKRLPLRGHGQRCIIYASSPRREVVGTCEFVASRYFRSSDIEREIRRACVSFEEFDAYFDDAHWARFEDRDDARWYALELAKPVLFAKPIKLESLRFWWHIEPPQQWLYIDRQTLDAIAAVGQ